jgi:UDP:flavonoid glycosyltransferase YjiC (YdhE family)
MSFPGAPASYADIMRRFGFGNADRLRSLVLAWRELFELVRPDVIVLHNAPVATLASFGLGARRITLGMGWDVPPLEAPMRRFWPRANVSAADIAAIHADVQRNASVAIRAPGSDLDTLLSELFRTDKRLLSTWPELDHYPDRPEPRVYVGPLFVDNVGSAICYPPGISPRFFVYLHAETPRLEEVIESLAQRDGRVIAVLPNLDAKTSRRLEARNWQVQSHAVRLDLIAGETDIAITNAGHGALSIFALKGVPCVYIPGNVDQLMLATRATEAGLGSLVRPGLTADIGTEIDAWTSETKSRSGLNAFRHRYKKSSVAGTVDTVIEHLQVRT